MLLANISLYVLVLVLLTVVPMIPGMIISRVLRRELPAASARRFAPPVTPVRTGRRPHVRLRRAGPPPARPACREW